MKTIATLLLGLAITVAEVGYAQSSVPKYGTFYLQSSVKNGRVPPPYPFDPYYGAEPVVVVDAANHIYLVQDNSNDWAELQQMRSAGQMSAMSGPEPPGSGSSGGELPNYPKWSPPTNGLWLEITNVNTASQLADLLVHATTNTEYYQLLSKTDLLQPEWTLGPYVQGDSGANQTPFDSVSISTNPTMFFWAHQADWHVELYAYPEVDAIEPHGTAPGQNGIISLAGTYAGSATNTNAKVTVYYRIGGTASNGVDYVTLSGMATLTNSGLYTVGQGHAEIDVQPLADNLVEGTETVTLTLVPTNGYVIDPLSSSATIHIYDSSTTVSIAPKASKAIRPDGPPGAPAVNGSFTISRSDFRNIYTNDLTVMYSVSGTATNGADYLMLSGTVDLAPGIKQTNIDVVPLPDLIAGGIETMTLTLIPANSYLVNSTSNAATILIYDSSTTVSFDYRVINAVEPGQNGNPPGQTGSFFVERSDSRGFRTNHLTVFYSVSGVASNGVDYVTLSGVMDLLADVTYTNIDVIPLADNLFEGDETVTLTLIPDSSDPNAYLISSSTPSATLTIADTWPANPFVTVANVNQPIGVDYDSLSNSLIVSYNYPSGAPFNFLRIYTNVILSNNIVVTNVVMTNWSGIAGLQDEVKLATAKVTANGFTNGQVFFSNNGATNRIGLLSPDATVSNLTFATLTNDTYIRGGICVDQSGRFGNNLIAVTGNAESGPDAGGGVWRINSSGIATRLANITNTHLEGVITLTNDPAKWGPWAGKIITGAEGETPPKIYAIDTNGTAVAYDTTAWIPGGIHPEDFDLIPPHQSLYGCDPDVNAIVKLSAGFLTNYVGDLLVTDSGEQVSPAKLFIVRWDAANTNFTAISVPYKRADGSNGHFEHVTFAPIELPTN